MGSFWKEVLRDLGKLFFGIFVKAPIQVGPSVPIPAPPPTSTPSPTTAPPPPISTIHVGSPQSPWWDGTYALTQPWGCTHLPFEPFNPRHPTCDHWHDGQDFGLPEGHPIYAGGNFVVAYVDDPQKFSAFGTAALGLIAGTQGHPEGHDVWLLHMSRYNVKRGDQLVRGSLVGWVGHRGQATGPHLHFQVVPRGGNYFSSIDPTPWVHMTR